MRYNVYNTYKELTKSSNYVLQLETDTDYLSSENEKATLSVKESIYQYFPTIIHLSHWFRIKAGNKFCNLYSQFTSFSQNNVLNPINTVQSKWASSFKVNHTLSPNHSDTAQNSNSKLSIA